MKSVAASLFNFLDKKQHGKIKVMRGIKHTFIRIDIDFFEFDKPYKIFFLENSLCADVLIYFALLSFFLKTLTLYSTGVSADHLSLYSLSTTSA